MNYCDYCKKDIDRNEKFYYKNLILCEDCFRNKKDEINANFKEIMANKNKPRH